MLESTSFVSGPELLSLPARQPVVAGRADGHPGRSALVVAAAPCPDRSQAWLAFAMSRHVVVDLSQTFFARPVDPPADRLPPERWKILRESLRQAGLEMNDGPDIEKRLTELRGMYEPFITAPANRLMIPLPPFFTDGEPVDNWQTSAGCAGPAVSGSSPIADFRRP